MLEIDRRFIYLFLLIALGLPLIFNYSMPPAQMKAADDIYEQVEELSFEKGEVAFVAIDFGPNTKAENESQTLVAVEHLMRRRIPIVFFSLVTFSEPFLKSVPEDIARKLADELPGEFWRYGKDWINLGYRQGASLFLQDLAKQKDMKGFLKADAYGTNLDIFTFLDDFSEFKDIKVLFEFTGYSGMIDRYLEFFSSDEHSPKIFHGGTSITTPESYIYLDSGQLDGLYEGIAGAAWYSKLLTDAHPTREVDEALVINTGLGIAHLVIIFLIIFGNVVYFISRRRT